MKPTGQSFAGLLVTAIRSHGLTLKKTAELSGRSYEHIRKLVNGEALPSELLVEKLAAVTGMPVVHAQQAAQRDRMLKQYGPAVLAQVAKTSSRVEEFAPLLNALTEEQAQAALAMLQGLLNAGHTKSKAHQNVKPVQHKEGRKFRDEEVIQN